MDLNHNGFTALHICIRTFIFLSFIQPPFPVSCPKCREWIWQHLHFSNFFFLYCGINLPVDVRNHIPFTTRRSEDLLQAALALSTCMVTPYVCTSAVKRVDSL